MRLLAFAIILDRSRWLFIYLELRFAVMHSSPIILLFASAFGEFLRNFYCAWQCFRRLYAIRKGVPSKRATYTALAVCLLPNVVNVVSFCSARKPDADRMTRVEWGQESVREGYSSDKDYNTLQNITIQFYFASSDFIHGEEIVPELLRLNRTVIPEWTYFGISKAWFNPELPHITVYRDKIGFRTWSSIFMIVIPFPVAYLTIMMVFLQIQSALKAAASSMSSKTKEAHVEIIKVCFVVIFL